MSAWQNMGQWQNLEYMSVYKEMLEKKVFELKDIYGDTAYCTICKQTLLTAVLDADPLARKRSIDFFNLFFPSNCVRKAYVEDGDVYFRIRGRDGLVRTFFVGEVSEYGPHSNGPVPFDLDSIKLVD